MLTSAPSDAVHDRSPRRRSHHPRMHIKKNSDNYVWLKTHSPLAVDRENCCVLCYIYSVPQKLFKVLETYNATVPVLLGRVGVL